MKRGLIVLFLAILFLPTILGIASHVTRKNFDVSLAGYADKTEKPNFSLSGVLNGEFQANYTAWYQENFYPRGLMIKNYSTILYNLFHLSMTGSIIGKNNDIFESAYIDAELCIEGYSDFSEAEPQAAAQLYMEKLELLQDKLEECGKTLYVVMTPSKADFNRENIPGKYIAMSDPDAIPGQEYLAELLNASDIPHTICFEDKDKHIYPTFYRSGIHWSQTFEQETLVNVLNDLAAYTGKSYPTIVLGDVRAQDTPFGIDGRDTDVFDLLNVWNPYTETYYQYDMQAKYPEAYDSLGILFHGTSFSIGFFEEYTSVLPFETAIYINRDQYVRTGSQITPFTSFDEVNISAILDQVDTIVMEILPSEVEQYGNGFVEALLATLETYTPSNPTYLKNLDTASPGEWDTHYFKGLHAKEPNHVWTKRESQITVQDEKIGESGLEINFSIPTEMFENTHCSNLKIYVNGTLTNDIDYYEPWDGSVVIVPEMLPETNDGVYTIRMICDTSFVPAEVNDSQDTRELSLSLTYIGSVR